MTDHDTILLSRPFCEDATHVDQRPRESVVDRSEPQTLLLERRERSSPSRNPLRRQGRRFAFRPSRIVAVLLGIILLVGVVAFHEHRRAVRLQRVLDSQRAAVAHGGAQTGSPTQEADLSTPARVPARHLPRQLYVETAVAESLIANDHLDALARLQDLRIGGPEGDAYDDLLVAVRWESRCSTPHLSKQPPCD